MKLNFGGVAKPRKFELGQLVVTDAIVDAMKDADFTTFLYTSFIRYCANDWGDIPKSKRKTAGQKQYLAADEAVVPGCGGKGNEGIPS